jgi:putative addiction module component (TIGR02574 family)
MSVAFEQVEREALQLSRQEQIILGRELLNNAYTTGTETEQAWYREAERRLAEYDKGLIKTLPGEDVMSEAFARFKKA